MRILGAALGIGLALGLALLLWPRQAAAPPDRQPSARVQPRIVDAPAPARPMRAPLTPEEELREEYSRKRQPFYQYLRREFGDQVAHFGVTESLDSLDLVVRRADRESLEWLVARAIAPTAGKYGFRKVRFYTANPETAVEPVTLVAETTSDGAGRWNTFLK